MNNSQDERQKEFEELLQGLSDGSEEAANRLVERYAANILRAIRKDLPKAIRSKLDSVDVFQSVWLSILARPERLAQLDSPQRLVAYLAKTAKFKVLEKYRHFTKMQGFDVRREQRMSDPIRLSGKAAEPSTLVKNATPNKSSQSPEALAEAREAWQCLVSNCSERDRQIVELRLAGKTYEVIAEQLGISTRTIKRTMKTLQHSVSDD